MPRRRGPSSRISVLLAAMVTFVVVAAPAVAASAAVPPYTMEERAAAIASPSLVLIEARTEGFLRSKATGKILHDESITPVYRCSGFAVGMQGNVISTTRCVEPGRESIHRSAASILANRLIRDDKLTSEQKDAYVDQLITTSNFTSADGREFPPTRIFGQIFQAWGGLTALPAFAGRIAESDPIRNLSLLKFEYENIPVVQIGTDQLEVGMSVVLLGFGTSGSSTPTAAYTVRSRSVRITGYLDDETPLRFILSDDIGDYSHGGMVVDTSGHVIGVISDDPSRSSRVNRIASSVSPVSELLIAANVSNTLSPRDRDFRAGLDAYFSGRYSEAIKQLDAVIEAVPDHTVAATYRQNAAERLAVEGDRTDGIPMWAIVSIVALSIVVVALAAILIVMWLGRRSGKGTVPLPPDWPISAVPLSAVPVSGYSAEQGAEHTQIPWHHAPTGDPFAVQSTPAALDAGESVPEPRSTNDLLQAQAAIATSGQSDSMTDEQADQDATDRGYGKDPSGAS